MARLRHTTVLHPVSRRRVESAISVAHQVAEGLRAQDGTLIAEDGRPVAEAELRAGEHLRPGARYAIVDGDDHSSEGEVLAWDRQRETGLRLRISERSGQSVPAAGLSTGARAAVELWLRSAERPRQIELTLDASLTHPDGRRKRLRWFTLKAELGLARWWDAIAGKPGPPALSVEVRHPILRASLQAAPRPDPRGVWQLDVVTTVRGRGLARPVAAVPLLVSRRVMHRGLGQALDRLAADWRTVFLPELAGTPEEFRQRLLDDLCRERAG